MTAPSRPFGSGAEPTKTNSNQPVTVVVTRLMREGHEPQYEEALVRLTGECQNMPGYLGATVRRPLQDANPREYSTIYRFASAGHLHQFDRSQAHQDFVAEVAPHVLADADWHDETGREFWFHPASAETREPVRWRMAAVSVVVVYVLVLLARPSGRRGSGASAPVDAAAGRGRRADHPDVLLADAQADAVAVAVDLLGAAARRPEELPQWRVGTPIAANCLRARWVARSIR